MSTRMNGAEMVISALEREHVQYVFGLPGATVIPVYDALLGAPFTHVLARHEQGACHAADGYARASGRVGVVFATSGPGATNLVTGIANAHMDSIPLVIFTGQVATSSIGTDAFQEADIYGSSLPLVKHSFLVRDVSELPRIVKGAFQIAATGRPGPVLIDLPVDVQYQVGEFDYPETVRFPGYDPETRQDLTRLHEAVDALNGAERPVILAGGGAIAGGAAEILRELAVTAQIPVATTLMGKGVFPEDHPLALGMLGMHGTPRANHAVSEADLIMAVGTRFSNRSTGTDGGFAQSATVVHVDIDSAELDKNVHADIALKGNATKVLRLLADKVDSNRDHSSWRTRIESWPYPGTETDEEALTPQRLLAEIQKRHSPEGVLTTEVGQHQMWSALFWRSRAPRTFITSGGLGTMGFGLPSAVGAAFARPGEPVVCISGDGSFLMNAQELDTCLRYHLPVKVVVMNNAGLGMVRQWQQLFWDERYAHTCEECPLDIERIARGYGVPARKVQSLDELEGAADWAFAEEGPVVLDCRIERNANVFPMVPPGYGLQAYLRCEEDVSS
ncbi:MAG: biosynthetic-type acetolactate synthase large subunit [Synergistales bacterium]|nr:biosynthetic-type acetolactate synthase large subunit [Synergistales bacterium]